LTIEILKLASTEDDACELEPPAATEKKLLHYVVRLKSDREGRKLKTQ
jgi:hypothetical protein